MDASFIIFSFTAGLVAFFAPCSFALLPGYIFYYVSKHLEKKPRTPIQLAASGMRFGLIASIGFFVVFGLSGLLVLSIGQTVKQFIPWIAMSTGIALISLGTASLMGKDVLVFRSLIFQVAGKSERVGMLLFGIAYAIGSLGCVFPLFLSIVIESLTKSFLEGSLIIFSYVAAMAIVMTTVTTLAFSLRYAVLHKLESILPALKKLSAILIIIAGAYMAYYQFAVLR